MKNLIFIVLAIIAFALSSCKESDDNDFIVDAEPSFVGFMPKYDYDTSQNMTEIRGNETLVFGKDFTHILFFSMTNMRYRISYPNGSSKWLDDSGSNSQKLTLRICDYSIEKEFIAKIEFYNDSRNMSIILKQPLINDNTVMNDYFDSHIFDYLWSIGLPEKFTLSDLRTVKSIKNNYSIEYMATLKLFPNLESIDYWRADNDIIDFNYLQKLKLLTLSQSLGVVVTFMEKAVKLFFKVTNFQGLLQEITN